MFQQHFLPSGIKIKCLNQSFEILRDPGEGVKLFIVWAEQYATSSVECIGHVVDSKDCCLFINTLAHIGQGIAMMVPGCSLTNHRRRVAIRTFCPSSQPVWTSPAGRRRWIWMDTGSNGRKETRRVRELLLQQQKSRPRAAKKPNFFCFPRFCYGNPPKHWVWLFTPEQECLLTSNCQYMVVSTGKFNLRIPELTNRFWIISYFYWTGKLENTSFKLLHETFQAFKTFLSN